ncbi:JAB domain-containing protein [Treponema primitia]|uniref:JAB domain-containing protein n=1 Tax=Treponema primitia TaxID=88058 RepID=UPI0002554E5F|nr:JAB domain-containing protein [Treponema primitia]
MLYEIVSERKVAYAGKIQNPDDIYDLVKRYAQAKKEQFIVVTLNSVHEPLSVRIVTTGLINRTIIHPREVFYPAIQDLATAVVLCHNHPSGDLEPSNEDKGITNRLVAAGHIIGVNVLDHLIIGKSEYFSFRKNGCLPEDDEILKFTLKDFLEGT